jgi:hypothetical protein
VKFVDRRKIAKVGFAIPALFFRTGITVLEDLRTVEKCAGTLLFSCQKYEIKRLSQNSEVPFDKSYIKILFNRYNGVILEKKFRTKMLLKLFN